MKTDPTPFDDLKKVKEQQLEVIKEKAAEQAKEILKEASDKELNDQQKVRRQKMNALREAGIDPFGKGYERTHRSGELRALYDEKTAEELDEINAEVSIAGRIMSKRVARSTEIRHTAKYFLLPCKKYINRDLLFGYCCFVCIFVFIPVKWYNLFSTAGRYSVRSPAIC